MDTIEKQILTTKETSEYLGISEDEVRRISDEGYLKRLRGFRKPRKFSRFAIIDYLKGEK